MGIEFNSGSLYISSLDSDPIEICGDLDVSMEYELSAKETELISYKINQSASFSYDISSIDLSLFEHVSTIAPHDKFTLQYYIDIMRQSRWHKKARVNKKWLKRYGIKPDRVKVLADATALDYNAPDGSFELESEKHRYVLRSDQQRRGLKIVW
jgi:hypothetical protein